MSSQSLNMDGGGERPNFKGVRGTEDPHLWKAEATLIFQPGDCQAGGSRRCQRARLVCVCECDHQYRALSHGANLDMSCYMLRSAKGRLNVTLALLKLSRDAHHLSKPNPFLLLLLLLSIIWKRWEITALFNTQIFYIVRGKKPWLSSLSL